MGVISGEILVDGQQRDASFQRKTGYVQQQDLHLPTSTVREALTFSALLRQPRHVPKREKLEYVDEVLKLLEMDGYADAVVGVPGEGECGGLHYSRTVLDQCVVADDRTQRRATQAPHHRCRARR